jgi:hypothetical protein
MSKKLGVIWNYDHVFKWKVKSKKFFSLLKIHIYSKGLTQNISHIRKIVNIINKKLQKISFKNSFLWKRCFLAKGFWKDNSL